MDAKPAPETGSAERRESFQLRNEEKRGKVVHHGNPEAQRNPCRSRAPALPLCLLWIDSLGFDDFAAAQA